jgi:hypothetical protein
MEAGRHRGRQSSFRGRHCGIPWRGMHSGTIQRQAGRLKVLAQRQASQLAVRLKGWQALNQALIEADTETGRQRIRPRSRHYGSYQTKRRTGIEARMH